MTVKYGSWLYIDNFSIKTEKEIQKKKKTSEAGIEVYTDI